MAFKSAAALRKLFSFPITGIALLNFSTSATRAQQYFPINDNLFGLGDDIHQVIYILQIIRMLHVLFYRNSILIDLAMKIIVLICNF